MKGPDTDPPKIFLNAQREHWENMFAQNADMFGAEPSVPARKAAALFKRENKVRILELGCGQGRDTLFFATEGFQICALDYSSQGLPAIRTKAATLGLTQSVSTLQHDVRQPLPFDGGFFEGCYSHMLYCMALTTGELDCLSKELLRVLKPGGLNYYTARSTNDAHYRTGIHHGEDMWEIGGGFIVHFFSRDKVEHLADGYDIISVEEIDEGTLPKKLFAVSLRKTR